MKHDGLIAQLIQASHLLLFRRLRLARVCDECQPQAAEQQSLIIAVELLRKAQHDRLTNP